MRKEKKKKNKMKPKSNIYNSDMFVVKIVDGGLYFIFSFHFILFFWFSFHLFFYF